MQESLRQRMPVGRRRLPADDAGEKRIAENLEEAYLYTAGEGGISASRSDRTGSTCGSCGGRT